ncbi:nSTAND3 domain-containing NTPase [Arthrobacter sp. R3-55]
MLGNHPEVERKHFKLWLASSEVLTSIVHSGIWARSEALLEDIQSRVRLYVPHDGYKRARDILDKRQVVVISGSPGVGKSMLAEMLLLTHWKESWQVVQVGSDIEEAWNAWKPKGRQIFLYDDFLGQTNSGERLSKNEDAKIAKFAHLVASRPDKRFVLTTRTQVLRQAQDSREPLRRAAFDLNNCVIKLSDYHRLHRARIVYNHLYFSELPRTVIREYVKTEAFWAALNHRNFSPRIVEQVLRRPHTDSRQLAAELAQALDRPVELWGPSFEHGLSDFARELLLTLVTHPTEGVLKSELLAVCSIKAQSLPTNQAFRALEGTWVRLTGSGPKLSVSFADPSCRDYVLAYLDSNPEEAMRLILATHTAEQAVLLLRYAVSVTQEEHRTSDIHPGIKAAIAETGVDLLTHLDDLFTDAVKANSDVSTLEHLLKAVLSSVSLIGGTSEDWLEAKINELSRYRHSSWHDLESLADLVLFMTQRHLSCADSQSDRMDQIEQSIALLGLALAEEARSESEFAIYRRISDDANTAVWLDSDNEGIFLENVRTYIRDDLGQVTSDYEDPDDMRQRLAELQDLGRDYGATDLEDSFTSTEEDINQRQNLEVDSEDLSPTIGDQAFSGPSGSSAPRNPQAARIREDNSIRALFRNLS